MLHFLVFYKCRWSSDLGMVWRKQNERNMSNEENRTVQTGIRKSHVIDKPRGSPLAPEL